MPLAERGRCAFADEVLRDTRTSVGFAIADPAIAEPIRKQILPWSVGTLAQDAATAILSDDEYFERSVALVEQQRLWLTAELDKLPGMRVYPSATNFVLARLDRGDLTAPQLADHLVGQGIAIRTFTPEQHLDQRYFRVAVRTEEENSRLCDALAAAMGEFSAARIRQPTTPSRSTEARAPPPKKRPTPAIMFQGTSSTPARAC